MDKFKKNANAIPFRSMSGDGKKDSCVSEESRIGNWR
jgi:hypothetical protein